MRSFLPRFVGLVALLSISTTVFAQIGGNEPKEGRTSQDGFTVIDLVNPISGVEVGRDRIRAFQVYSSSANFIACRLMLKIYRQEGPNYRLVGSSNLVDVFGGQISTFACNIPVRNGDLVGFSTADQAGGAIDYDDSDPSLNASVGYAGDVGTVAIANGSVLPYVRSIRVLGLASEETPATYRTLGVVPVVVRAPGANETLFRTEAVLHNPRSEGDATVTLRFVPTETDGATEGETAELTLTKNQVVTIRDVLLEKFEKDAATGLLEVAADVELLSRWRIVNDTANGPFGQDVPLIATADGLLFDPNPVDDAGTAIHLAGAVESPEYRTNFGVVNLSKTDEVELSLQPFDANGDPLAEAKTYRVPRFSHKQWNRVLPTEFGLLDTVTDVRLVATPLAGSEPEEGDTETIDSTDGRLYVYLSIIDNRTEDPVFVPGARRSSL